MMRIFCLGMACLVAALMTSPVAAQRRHGGLVSAEAARHHGLDIAWHTQVQVSRANGRVAYLTQHVNEWMSIEVKVGNLSWRFSERDRSATGEMIGRQAAADLADAKMSDLQEHFLKPTLTTTIRADVRLYAVTDRGLLHALDGETGETLWTQQVGDSSFPTTAVGANDDLVAVCNGSTIYCYDRRNGRLIWSRDARYTVSAGPALTNESVAVPTLRGVIEWYKLDQDKRSVPHLYRSQGAVRMQPMTTPRSVAWGTETGHMYVADAASGRVRFRLEASSTIVGAPAYLAPRYFFVATLDGYVYCCDEMNGEMLWRYSTGGSISESPMAVGETVYVATNEGELHAIDYLSGRLKDVRPPAQVATTPAPAAPNKTAAAAPPPPPPSPGETRRWPIVDGIRSIISVSPTRIYCEGRPGQLVIVDSNTGTLLGTVPLGSPEVILQNRATDRIILGTSTGLLQCLRERDLVQPHVHEVEREKTLATRAEVVVDTGDEPAPMARPAAKPAENDPFGAPPMNDPFGAPPKAEADPFGAPPKMEDDPFGAPPDKAEPAAPAEANDPFG